MAHITTANPDGSSSLSNTAGVGIGVPAATAAAHAAQLQMVGLFPTIASAATIDPFGAQGASVNISGTTTVTGLTACTAAQVGSTKTITPTNAAGFSFTASANLIVDGYTTGTYNMPLNAVVQITPLTTTQFRVTTIFASGTFTTSAWTGGGSSLSYVTGNYTKTGRQVTFQGGVNGTALTGTAGTHTLTMNLPWLPPVNALVGVTNATTSVNIGGYFYSSGLVYVMTTFTATTQLVVTGTYSV